MKHAITIGASALLLLAQLAGCDEFDGNCIDGVENCPCHDNGTCDNGLDCSAGVCGAPFASNGMDGPLSGGPPGFSAGSGVPATDFAEEGSFGSPMVAPTPTPPMVTTPSSIPCGQSACANPAAAIPIPGLVPPACCVDAVEGICGFEDGAGGCTAQPDSDPRCPSLVTGFGLDAASCCIEASNECGLFPPPGTTGTDACQSLTDVGALGGAASGLIAFPDPVDCDGNPWVPGADSDAGAD